ncbi:MAG: hypothetical protein H7844_03740 [Nitrospirae bacterium YQR-1]
MEKFSNRVISGILALGLAYVFSMLHPVLTLADEAVDPENLFESKCNQCHSTDRPKGAKKTPSEWKDTVIRMKLGYGCNITDEEAKIIIKYLSEKYPNTK